jgi:hypothetical protein
MRFGHGIAAGLEFALDSGPHNRKAPELEFPMVGVEWLIRAGCPQNALAGERIDSSRTRIPAPIQTQEYFRNKIISSPESPILPGEHSFEGAEASNQKPIPGCHGWQVIYP